MLPFKAPSPSKSSSKSSSPTNPFTDAMGVLKRHLPLVILFSFLANALLLVSSIYMLQVFDRVLSTGSLETLGWLTVITIVAIIAYGLLEHARRQMLSRTGTWLDSELSGPVLRRMVRARLSNTASDAGLSDVSDVRAFVSGDGILAFLDAPWSPVFILLIWLMHPMLGVIAVAGAVLLFLAGVLNDGLTRRRAQAMQQDARAGQQSGHQIVEGAVTLSALGMTDPMVRRWQQQRNAAALNGLRTGDITASLYNTSRALRLALQVLILGVGAYYVLQGALTGGAMIAASIILSRALSPVERSIGAWRAFVAARSGYRSLQALFADGDEVARVRLPAPTGRLEAAGLTFVPPGQERPTLNTVDFALAPGETCGIVGPSGAGKSTLCRLLVGAWGPSSGHVRLDGADVSRWDDADLGQHVGYLSQQVELFAGTVADNIARMRDADDADIIAAARMADVHDMILRLPDGYETDVGVHGGKLSGGQRQRLGLARALFGNPRLIVLDEPSSNLDTEGEAALVRALAALKEDGRTILVVTHQANLLRGADKILMLRDGQLAAFGTQENIMRALAARAAPQSPGPQRPAAAANPAE